MSGDLSTPLIKQNKKQLLELKEVLKLSYTDLKNLAAKGRLTPGKSYAFNHTCYHLIDNSGGVESDDTIDATMEVFVVTAITNSNFDLRVYSLTHPEDIIEYSFDSDLWEDLKSSRTMGKVLFRSGLINSNVRVDAKYDFRRCVYRTWHADLSGSELSNDGTMNDEPALWKPSLVVGKASASTAKITINDNGSFTDSYFADLTKLGNPTWVPSAEIKLGTYRQNVVFLPSRKDPAGLYYVSGNYEQSTNIRTRGTMSTATDGDYSNNGERAYVVPAINGFIHCPYVTGGNEFTHINCRVVTDSISFFTIMKLLGAGAMVNSLLRPRLSASGFYPMFQARLQGLIRACRFDGQADNGQFAHSFSHIVLECLTNVTFYGWVNQDYGAELRHVNNHTNTAPALVEKLTEPFMDIRCHNLIKKAISPAAGVLTTGANQEYAHVGIIETSGAIATITRLRQYRHRIVLKATGGSITLNSGGNIVNATGASYASGKYIVLEQVEVGTFIITANS